MSSITPTIPIERPVIRPRPVTVSVPVADVTSAADSPSAAGAVPRARPLGLSRARSERRFFLGITIAMAVVCFAGFAPSYYLKSQLGSAPALRPMLHLHGLVFTLWMLLMVAQASLISAGKANVHRALGMASAVLVPLMIITGAAVIYGRATTVTPGVPQEMILAFLAIAVVALGVFPLLIGAALLLRRDAAAHKRLMVIATTVFLSAAVHRLLMWAVDPAVTPPVFFAATDLFLVAIVVYDVVSRGRVHWATVVGGVTVVGSQLGSVVLAGSGGWMSVARWVVEG